MFRFNLLNHYGVWVSFADLGFKIDLVCLEFCTKPIMYKLFSVHVSAVGLTINVQCTIFKAYIVIKVFLKAAASAARKHMHI